MTDSKDSENKSDDIEFIFEDIGGTFGKFQIYNYILFAVPIFLSGAYILDYVFSGLDLDYRCRIPECDIGPNTDYNPYWLENAVPFKNSKPMRCMRYEPILDVGTHPESGSCDATAFNRSSVVECSSGEFIYRTDEVSIVNEFNITCMETNWKLSMIGVTNNIARFIFLPIFGILSDRIGRVPVLVICACATSIFKLISSFSVSYEMFVILTFLDAGACSAIYPAAFILGMEWASAKKRIFVSSIIMILNPFGPAVTAFVASKTHNFKLMLRIISLPGLLLIVYIWLARESLRWLLVKKKYNRAMEVVARAVKINKIELSQCTFDIIEAKCKNCNNVDATATEDGDSSQSLKNIILSTKLFFRFVICILCWIGSIFILYGMSIASVSLPGDKYWNFSIAYFADGPAVILSYFTLTYLGRKWTMCSSMILSGVTIIACNYVRHMPTVSLILFFMGKIFIRHAAQSMYVFTGELWPTSSRSTILNTCSMFGRIGSILAPMTPLLTQYMESLPYFLFCGTAFIVGLLYLLLPETFNTKLPDTIEEAMSIGKEAEHKSVN